MFEMYHFAEFQVVLTNYNYQLQVRMNIFVILKLCALTRILMPMQNGVRLHTHGGGACVCVCFGLKV